MPSIILKYIANMIFIVLFFCVFYCQALYIKVEEQIWF